MMNPLRFRTGKKIGARGNLGFLATGASLTLAGLTLNWGFHAVALGLAVEYTGVAINIFSIIRSIRYLAQERAETRRLTEEYRGENDLEAYIPGHYGAVLRDLAPVGSRLLYVAGLLAGALERGHALEEGRELWIPPDWFKAANLAQGKSCFGVTLLPGDDQSVSVVWRTADDPDAFVSRFPVGSH